jgi:hypothetical protein
MVFMPIIAPCIAKVLQKTVGKSALHGLRKTEWRNLDDSIAKHSFGHGVSGYH